MSGPQKSVDGVPSFFESLSELDDYFARPRKQVPQPDRLGAVSSRADNPKLLVCHDYKGGYNDNPAALGYTFQFWHIIDTFIYFSHYRVAPPPASWIHTAHRHGVPILGTLIFEHKESEPDVTLLVQPESENLRHYAVRLAELAVERGFDGWLLNIEVSLPGGKDHVQRVVEWTCLLREELRARVGPHAQVIWYDSVIDSGKLAWQDRLCMANDIFFRAAGQFFTNYTWAPHYPLLSIEHLRLMQENHDSIPNPPSGHLITATELTPRDIFVGIDVWGRGTHGGGGFSCHAALDHIVGANIPQSSVALFAPGWTWEHKENETGRTWHAWWKDELRFWVGAGSLVPPGIPLAPLDGENSTQQYQLSASIPGIEATTAARIDTAVQPDGAATEQADLMPGFFPAQCLHTKFRHIAHFFPEKPAALPFGTVFNLGVGMGWFHAGKKVSDGAWTDVAVQTFVPHGEAGVGIEFEDAWMGGASMKVDGRFRLLPVRRISLASSDTGIGQALHLSVTWKPLVQGVSAVPVIHFVEGDDRGTSFTPSASDHQFEELTLPLGWRTTRARVPIPTVSKLATVGIQLQGVYEDLLVGALSVSLEGQALDSVAWVDVFDGDNRWLEKRPAYAEHPAGHYVAVLLDGNRIVS